MYAPRRPQKPGAFTTYTRLHGRMYNDSGLLFADMVRAIKRARPDMNAWQARFRILNYPLNPSNYTATSGIMTLEGLYQGVAIDWLIKGRYTSHGAPIPIKRVVVTGQEKTYKLFASTFALLVKWGDGSLYVPFKGRYARAEVKDGEIVIEDAEDTKPIEYFTAIEAVLRGGMYQIVYDFYRLRVEPPERFIGFVIQPVRGPFKNILKNVRVLKADMIYFFVPPNLRDLGVHRRVLTKLLQLQGSDEELFEVIGGHGYHGYGTIAHYEIGREPRMGSDPRKVLFARWGDYYVNLRPIPVDAVEPDWVVWGHGNYVALRLNPPYYVPSYRVKNLVHQYLPGTVFKHVPSIVWEVGQNV